MESVKNTVFSENCNTSLSDEEKRNKKLQRCKSDYRKNRKQRLAYQKAHDQTNKERITDYQKNHYIENKEQYAARRRNSKAKRRNATGKHTGKDIKTLFVLQKSKCAICRISIIKEYHVDHIVAIANGGSNDKYNLQLLCPCCNREKKAKDPIVFMQERGMLI